MIKKENQVSKLASLPNQQEAKTQDGYDRFASSSLPSGIQTEFILIPGILSVGEALTIIQSRQKKSVVIHHWVNNTRMYYLFLFSRIQDLLMNHRLEEVVAVALALNENNHSMAISASECVKRLREDIAFYQPAVVVDHGTVVGYIEPDQGPAKMEDPDEMALTMEPEYDLEEMDDASEPFTLIKMDGLDFEKTSDPVDISRSGERENVSFEKPHKTGPKGRYIKDIKFDPSTMVKGLDKIEIKKKGPRSGIPRPAGATRKPEAPTSATRVYLDSNPLCHFAALMPEEVAAGHMQPVEVTLSREEIELVNSKTSQKSDHPVSVSPDQKITVRLIPKRNLTVIGDSRADVDVPIPGMPAVTLFFDVMGGSCGEGELWVAFCQGPLSLLTLKLNPRIVEEPTAAGKESIQARTSATPSSGPPSRLNTMWVYHEENSGKTRYRYCLWMDDMDIDQEYESPEFTGDVLTILQPYMSLFDEVETETRTDFHQLQIQLRSIGAKLFQTLFPKDLQRVFWENRDKIKHLKLYCEEPYIPWEILHVCEPGKPLPAETKFLGQMGLVRWLHGHTAPTQLRIRPGRAWYVTPSYPGNELESAKQEGKLLKRLFGAKPVKPATRPEVTKLLSAEGPFDLFHFAGHGEASEARITDCRIELEAAGANANSLLKDLTPDIVSGLCQLKGQDGTRPIVVLNSCRAGKMGYQITGLGGFAPAFLEREAGVFIGALWMIGDQPALTFIKGFYEALREGKMVSEAVTAGREKAYASGDATYLAYVVYADPFAHLV
ncbi:MAG: CHAT domain-containing protein [Proteobacteria bacterium]|nr:CHAT domain-containing protein [Pseudomonadota bacterium]MBU4469991.1 CHAT domain-containing protein [Pseudomonadota bacterium]MCG2753754.1 CHAT domain-containing protein [Desulfobacteraceae bacterium]